MTFLDLLRTFPALSDPQLSPDGLTVAYVQDAPDWKQNKRIGHIWRIRARRSHPEQLTRGERGESSPRWSPDGTNAGISCHAASGQDDAQIQLLPMAGGEARAFSAHVTAVSAIQWSPDGSRIYFLADEAKTIEERARRLQRPTSFSTTRSSNSVSCGRSTSRPARRRALTTGDSSVT